MEKKKLFAFLNNSVNKNTFLSCGYANGYVAIPPEHKLHEKDYYTVDNLVDVHGGLTYGEPITDCKKWEDIEPINFKSMDEIPDDYKVYGFDTMHFQDGPHLNKKWCVYETLSLMEQLEKLY